MEGRYVITLKELAEKFSDVEPATISLDYWGIQNEDVFGFHFLNSERTGFNLNVKTGKIEVFR